MITKFIIFIVLLCEGVMQRKHYTLFSQATTLSLTTKKIFCAILANKLLPALKTRQQKLLARCMNSINSFRA